MDSLSRGVQDALPAVGSVFCRRGCQNHPVAAPRIRESNLGAVCHRDIVYHCDHRVLTCPGIFDPRPQQQHFILKHKIGLDARQFPGQLDSGSPHGAVPGAHRRSSLNRS